MSQFSRFAARAHTTATTAYFTNDLATLADPPPLLPDARAAIVFGREKLIFLTCTARKIDVFFSV